MENHKIHLTVKVERLTVVADPEGVTQALRNYLDNAIKFSREVVEPRIVIGAEESDRSCRVWVRDNGIGFDMTYHDRIFEIFQRLHRDEDCPGTGIGLALVRKAMERMGGRTWAESAVGRGATFYLEIPLRK
jgi:signal transduction histidine kinase